MALIKCSECQKEISDKAKACPQCGNPISSRGVVKIGTDPENPIKIEPLLTSKTWKKVKILAWLVIIFGWIVAGNSNGSEDPSGGSFWIGIGVVMIGFVVLIVGAIGAWYSDRTSR